MSMRVAAVATVVVGVGLTACSSDSESGTSAATATTPSVCDSADDLRTSLAQLRDVQVVQEGTGALEEAWATVQDAWDQFADAARTEYSDDVDRVQASADGVQDALDEAQDTPSAATLSTAATATGLFLQDADALVDETEATC
ncbi:MULTISPECIES: hypothetical protein [unclassified Geodermatophilus]|uniref:hypothetical protein n=1 Tax=unclassified Geodermatophilus TaxID=2637632 RepID=UPI003EE986B4